MTRRLGLFGGTFDPPHRGHLAAARAVRDALALDEVLLIVAGDPWQKTAAGTVSPAAVRLEMVRALVEGEPGLGVDPSETERPGPTYTVETLERWRAREPETDLFFIVGSDTLARIPTWNRWQDLCDLSTIVVVNRAPLAETPVPRGLDPDRVVQVAMEPVDVSSSALRAAVGRGESITEWTGETVSRIVSRHGFYGAHP
ncbi:MAG: nicotinate (nicotinamide) nucleotide adenylyltransferase [Actinomycetota bacterium]|jgi:nicotinate-nucleotide adenylyltransferase